MVQVSKDLSCNERKIQHHSDLGQLVIKSRTVVFYGWDFLLLSLPYVVVRLEQYRPEYLSLDVRNKRLFVTYRARSDAERLFSDKRFKILTLPDKINIKFASNYPRARCSSDFGLTGVYRVHPSEMDNNLRSYSAREIGSAFLKAHFNQVAAWLTPEDLKIAQQFGGLWLGGFEIEEPYSIREAPQDSRNYRVLSIYYEISRTAIEGGAEMSFQNAPKSHGYDIHNSAERYPLRKIVYQGGALFHDQQRGHSTRLAEQHYGILNLDVQSVGNRVLQFYCVTSRRWQGDIIDYYCTSEVFGRTQLKSLGKQFIAETGMQHELSLMRFDFYGMCYEV
ncbi:hypothetical protein MIR68_008403 [Amoeboaphelidium protococcarum]|nr:hypothetical protein MIR68_008403 [Amoeboaphelidium protococcarum]